jgi:hypothetical protein
VEFARGVGQRGGESTTDGPAPGASLPAQYAPTATPAPHGGETAPPPGDEEEDGLVAAPAACAPLLDPGAEGGRCPLLEVFAQVRDRRDPRGVRHTLPSIPATAVAAACGEKSLAAITQWAECAEADQEMPAFLGTRRDPATGRFRAPHADTFGRVLGALDAQSRRRHGRWPACLRGGGRASRGRPGISARGCARRRGEARWWASAYGRSVRAGTWRGRTTRK